MNFVFILLASRSQRDVAGEKEARLRQLQDLEERLRRVEGEISTAENDRRQFDAALRETHGKLQAHRCVSKGTAKQ